MWAELEKLTMDGSVPGAGLFLPPGPARQMEGAAGEHPGWRADWQDPRARWRAATGRRMRSGREGVRRKKYLDFTLLPLLFSPCALPARPKCTSRARESGQAGRPVSEQVGEMQSGGPGGLRDNGQRVHFWAGWRRGCGLRPNKGWPVVLVTLTTAIWIKKT